MGGTGASARNWPRVSATYRGGFISSARVPDFAGLLRRLGEADAEFILRIHSDWRRGGDRAWIGMPHHDEGRRRAGTAVT